MRQYSRKKEAKEQLINVSESRGKVVAERPGDRSRPSLSPRTTDNKVEKPESSQGQKAGFFAQNDRVGDPFGNYKLENQQDLRKGVARNPVSCWDLWFPNQGFFRETLVFA
ncbi:hypothetical protein [Microseira wollei]|uniref:Uncharacterized protein n=1 Tax=Microseira wollei NIES-4236 TaxID=2530354 RepID=A0AAV3X9L4_9CYAN|nr:hypothetical protein [Microseira wollei]GET37410.1 hypothetical protein MiSe_21630 [Microseira wollei NIES-4236]